MLLLKGENDSQTSVQQAFLLQQRLTEVNHPDHTLITYPEQDIYSILHQNGQQVLDRSNSMFQQIFTHGLKLIQVFHIPMLLLLLLPVIQRQIWLHLVQIQLLTPPPAVTDDFRCFWRCLYNALRVFYIKYIYSFFLHTNNLSICRRFFTFNV